MSVFFQTPLVIGSDMEVDDSKEGKGNDPSRYKQCWVHGLAHAWKKKALFFDKLMLLVFKEMKMN